MRDYMCGRRIRRSKPIAAVAVVALFAASRCARTDNPKVDDGGPGGNRGAAATGGTGGTGGMVSQPDGGFLGCRASEQTCATTADCCEPLVCAANRCAARAAPCRGNAASCATIADCCGGLGCQAGKCQLLPACADGRWFGQSYELNPVRDLDVLFVIDNSPSMQEEQDNLNRNFPVFINALKAAPGGLPNLHIGVVSSDLGAGPTAVGSCTRPGGDRGIFQAKAGCMLDPSHKFMVSLGNGMMNNFQGDISTVFGCLANLGAAGCAFEHQLQAARVALDESRTPENAGFLRESAYLAIIFLTDEDDCSGDADSDLYAQDIPGTAASFRCAQYGHTCGGEMPPAMAFMRPLETCQAADGGRLIRVREIVDAIRALKKRPEEQILVAGIIGWPTNPTGALYRYGGMSLLDFLPVCQAAGGTATAGLRMKAFVDAFGSSGRIFSVCQNDYRHALEGIGNSLVARLATPCLAAPLLDTDLTAPGVQPECQVVDHLPVPGGFKDSPVVPCGTGATPCWRAEVDNVTCTQSSYRITVDRGVGVIAPPGARQSVRCLTCSRSESYCCRR